MNGFDEVIYEESELVDTPLGTLIQCEDCDELYLPHPSIEWQKCIHCKNINNHLSGANHIVSVRNDGL